MIEVLVLKNCTSQFTYWDNLSDSPLGVCWIRFYLGQNKEKVAILLNIMTSRFHRRKGVATELLNEVLKETKVIVTPSGSDEGGKEFIKHFGFIHNDSLNVWAFIKKGA